MALPATDGCTTVWVRDVSVGVRAMTTTGGQTWDAARALADYLEAEWSSLGIRGRGSSSPLRALELGSGTGWLGMTLARNVATEASHVCLTEQEQGGGVEWLEENVARNAHLGVPLTSVRAAALDWSDWAHESADGMWPDADCLQLIFGSDLVYNEAGVKLLPRVLRGFLRAAPEVLVLYCHTLHRFDNLDLEFFQMLRDLGLEYRPVAAQGSGANGTDPLNAVGDPSKGFLEELFPEKRIVIYQIRLVGSDRLALAWSIILSDANALAIEESDVRPGAQAGRSAFLAAPPKGFVQVGRICIMLPGGGEPPPPAELRQGSQEEASEQSPPGVTVRLRRLGPFGSGEHPTTALMLQAMQSLRAEGRLKGLAVLDYGCGSGVLALTALALGAGHCAAIDIVPEALDAACENAEANAVWLEGVPSENLRLHLPPVEALDKDIQFLACNGDWRDPGARHGWTPMPDKESGSYDVVLANIVVGPLCHSACVVRSLLRERADVLMSGIRGEVHVQQVEAAYGPDFHLRHEATLDGWVLLRGRFQAELP